MDKRGEDQIDDKDQWEIIDAFFKQNGVVNQQIQSYNQFVEHTISDCVREHQANFVKIDRQFIPGQEDIYDERTGGDVCLQAIFGQVHMDAKPTLKDPQGGLYPYFPSEARIRNLTYQIEASVDFHIEKRRRYGNKPGTAKEDLLETYETKEKTTLCKIPVMVHSKPC